VNAADYFFISTRMAKAYPTLVESIIVESYYTYLPGEISKKWLLGATARIARHSRLMQATLFSGLMLGLQRVVTAPSLVQRMLIRFTQPLFLTALILFWQLVDFTNPLYVLATTA
jgi:hypothetical protein